MINKNEVADFLSKIINEGIGLSPLNEPQRIEYLEKLHEFINVILQNILFENTDNNDIDTDDDDLNNISFY